MARDKAKKTHRIKRKKGKKFRVFDQPAKSDPVEDAENPFETHFRNVALKNRDKERKGLIEEYKSKGKAGGIVDRRFGGEKESAMATRYIIERKRNTKKRKFDLDSDSDGGQDIKLTHNGRTLDDVDDYEISNKQKQEKEDDEFLDDQIVEQLHFGGKTIDADDQKDDFFKIKKTKEEVFKEIVAKSKIFKAARAEIRDQNEQMIDELDGDFAEIFPLLSTRDKQRKEQETNPGKLPEPSMSLLEVSQKQKDKQKSILKKADMRKRDQKNVRKADIDTDYNYDQLAVELKNSARARPQLLVKSEKEKAIDRKEELEKLEKNIRATDEIAEQLDEESDEDESEVQEDDKNDPELMNNALVDLLENEYGESEEDEPDEFEAIHSESSEEED